MLKTTLEQIIQRLYIENTTEDSIFSYLQDNKYSTDDYIVLLLDFDDLGELKTEMGFDYVNTIMETYLVWLRNEFPPDAYIIRYPKSDCFLIVLSYLTDKDINKLIKDLLKNTKKDFDLTISIGGTSKKESEKAELISMLRDTKKAITVAKKSGKNQACLNKKDKDEIIKSNKSTVKVKSDNKQLPDKPSVPNSDEIIIQDAPVTFPIPP